VTFYIFLEKKNKNKKIRKRLRISRLDTYHVRTDTVLQLNGKDQIEHFWRDWRTKLNQQLETK